MTRKPAWLSGRNSDGSLHNWELDPEQKVIIGRREPADIVLPFPRISRQHACIEYADFNYQIRDMDSKNGTFVNGAPLSNEARRLVADDEIVVGGIVSFKFNDPDETMAGPLIGRIEGVWIDPDSRTVWVDSKPVDPPLSSAQYTLLTRLYRTPNTIVPRDAIISEVWPGVDPSGVSSEAVDGVIKRLRQRLRDTQPDKEYVAVVRGHGLRLIES